MQFSLCTLQRHMWLSMVATAAALGLSACGGGITVGGGTENIAGSNTTATITVSVPGATTTLAGINTTSTLTVTLPGATTSGQTITLTVTAPITAFNTSSVMGPTRVVANTLQTYSTEAASAYNWQWGDTSPSSSSSQPSKVWYRSGVFNAAVAWVSGHILGIATQAVSVADPLAAGVNHSCALRGDGTVSCWGRNTSGALGDGTFLANTTNATVVELNNAVAIKAGANFACALKSDSGVNCWGSNSSGQLGAASALPASASVLAVSGLSDAVAIAVGKQHACAIRYDSSVLCWGANGSGQLGIGSLVSANAPKTVLGYGGTGTLSGVVSLSLGDSHSCALKDDGTVACWGSNNSSQLGQGYDPIVAIEFIDSNIPKPVPNFSGAVALASGSPNAEHTCALKADSSMWCWGKNNAGQLGDGTLVRRSTPIAVQGLTGSLVAVQAGTAKTQRVFAVAIGAEHSCATGYLGLVYCWGANAKGQLGNTSNTNSSLPTDVAGSGDAVALSLGDAHSCYLRSDGAVRCFGANDSEQLALGVGPNQNTPTPLITGGLGVPYWSTTSLK